MATEFYVRNCRTRRQTMIPMENLRDAMDVADSLTRLHFDRYEVISVTSVYTASHAPADVTVEVL